MDIRSLPNAEAQPSHRDPLPADPARGDFDQDEAFDYAEYWRIVRRHKWGIVSIALLCILVGLVIAVTSTPIYQAQARLLAEPIQPNFNANDQASASQLVWLFYETQFDVIRSRAVAERVVDKLGLVARADAQAQQGQDSKKGGFGLNWRD